MDAARVAEVLGLLPHPEGGHYRETWRDEPADGSRGTGTAIYFLLAAGERSAWHRLDATELWHFHAGAPLVLRLAPDERTPPVDVWLGADLDGGQRPQAVVPARWWQSAASAGDWTLVSCTVSPAFSFGGFELASPRFEPGRP